MKSFTLHSFFKTVLVGMVSLVWLSGAHGQILGWTQVASPNPGPLRSMLRGVSGTSSADIWAVGHYQTSPAGVQYTSSNLIMHWNGSGWQVYPPLDPTNRSNDLYAVEAIDSNNVWAAGLAGNSAQPQLLHYNGTSWSQQTIANVPNTAYFSALKAFGPSDIWATGGRSPIGTTLPYPAYALHYNGSSWTEVPVPTFGNGWHEISEIDGVSGNNVWGAGYWTPSPTYANSHFMLLHWNGSAWTDSSSKLPASVTSRMGYFTELKVIAANDVWATGYFEGGGYVMLHYNGSTWSEVPRPVSSASLAPFSSTDIYDFGAEISHWDGNAWTIEDSLLQHPNPAFASSVILPDGDVWAVGRAVDANNIFTTLVYRSIGNHPMFINGPHQQWQALNTGTNSLSNVLATNDSDVAQVLTYKIVQQPMHGTLSGFPVTAISRNGSAQPMGVGYTAASGYSGIDSFVVEVTVGKLTSRTTVVANVVSSLPISLISFNASKLTEGVLLKWVTSSEVNSSYFMLEHSVDGRSYTSIANVKAVGNSTLMNSYSYLHTQAVKGINYYRLTSVDRDGKMHVYPVVVVNGKGKAAELSVYPNPATDLVTVSYDGMDKGVITISSLSGKLLQTTTIQGSTSEVSISNLASGVYVLQLTTGDGKRKTTRLIKQ